MSRTFDKLKKLGYTPEEAIRCIRRACELIEAGDVDPGWRDRADASLPKAGNVCGVPSSLAHDIWEDLK